MRKFIKVMALECQVRISFRLNILRLKERNLIKFCIRIDIDKLWVGIVMHHLVQVYNRFCLFDLILHVPSTIFQLNRDVSSWVKPVLS